QVLVGVDTHPAAPTVLVGLGIHTRHQLVVIPLPGRRHASTQSATVDVGGHSHHWWRAQAVVVHHVIGVVVIHPCFDLFQVLAEVGFLEAQRNTFPLELAAIHAT